jgi:hypothetical protein
MKDIADWHESSSAKRYFSEKTLGAVKKTAIARWLGTPPHYVGLTKSSHILGILLDPYTTPKGALPEKWEASSREVLSKFYSGTVLEVAMDELKSLLMRHGARGDVINDKQKNIEPPS